MCPASRKAAGAGVSAGIRCRRTWTVAWHTWCVCTGVRPRADEPPGFPVGAALAAIVVVYAIRG